MTPVAKTDAFTKAQQAECRKLNIDVLDCLDAYSNCHNKRDAANLTWIYQTAYRYSNYRNTRNVAKLYHKLL